MIVSGSSGSRRGRSIDLFGPESTRLRLVRDTPVRHDTGTPTGSYLDSCLNRVLSGATEQLPTASTRHNTGSECTRTDRK